MPEDRTPDGREIVRTRHGAFTRENGALYPYYTPEEETARIERFLNKPARQPAPRWDVWRS